MEILYQQQVKKLRSLQNEKSQKTRMINKLTKNYLVNKVAFLFSGLLVTNIINLLGFFIIAKLFSVTTLGEYYMFIATASILNVFLTLGYLHSIPILKDDELKDIKGENILAKHQRHFFWQWPANVAKQFNLKKPLKVNIELECEYCSSTILNFQSVVP